MTRFCFKYYYIGLEKYFGSQRQKKALSIDETLIKTLKKRNYIKDSYSSKFESASRTDRYVSARGAVFAIDSLKKPILMELNSNLPKEIGIWAYSQVPENFSPRFNAQMRHYKYIIPQPLGYLKNKFNFNLKIVKRVCQKLVGTHDFQNFSKRDSDINNTIREIKAIDVNVINGIIIIDFKSEGFLRQQIRRIVKKLIELGKGEISYNSFIKLLDPLEFRSYQPANPKGLILWDIEFDNKLVMFKIDKKSLKRMNNFFFSQKMKYFLQYNLFSLLQQDDLGKKSF